MRDACAYCEKIESDLTDSIVPYLEGKSILATTVHSDDWWWIYNANFSFNKN